jgi:hypothetical protein
MSTVLNLELHHMWHNSQSKRASRAEGVVVVVVVVVALGEIRQATTAARSREVVLGVETLAKLRLTTTRVVMRLPKL